ncbi:MAG TPA: hypothetical protein VN328_02445, partial [Thermodesulfovibrionales bacterium]|nr:hypothetical protein [Thermodesulfovibrionales bacterium]
GDGIPASSSPLQQLPEERISGKSGQRGKGTGITGNSGIRSISIRVFSAPGAGGAAGPVWPG